MENPPCFWSSHFLLEHGDFPAIECDLQDSSDGEEDFMGILRGIQVRTWRVFVSHDSWEKTHEKKHVYLHPKKQYHTFNKEIAVHVHTGWWTESCFPFETFHWFPFPPKSRDSVGFCTPTSLLPGPCATRRGCTRGSQKGSSQTRSEGGGAFNGGIGCYNLVGKLQVWKIGENQSLFLLRLIYDDDWQWLLAFAERSFFCAKRLWEDSMIHHPRCDNGISHLQNVVWYFRKIQVFIFGDFLTVTNLQPLTQQEKTTLRGRGRLGTWAQGNGQTHLGVDGGTKNGWSGHGGWECQEVPWSEGWSFLEPHETCRVCIIGPSFGTCRFWGVIP